MSGTSTRARSSNRSKVHAAMMAAAGGLLALVATGWGIQPSPAFLDSTSLFSCAKCHRQEVEAIAKTPHDSRGFLEMTESEVACDSCHGVGAAHSEDPGDKMLMEALGLQQSPGIGVLSPTELSAKCLECHQGRSHSFWPGSRHEARNLSCVSCHSMHAFRSESRMLRGVNTQETCFGCHKGIRAQTWKSSHHPIREGKISCIDCHDQHGSPAENLLAEATNNDLCYNCHADKRGPFLWEHAPVREDCNSCHTPHGSNHRRLLQKAVPFLCQQCHSNTRHPGTLYDRNSLADAPGASNRMFNRACLNCHASIHGSNHPSSPYLGQ